MRRFQQVLGCAIVGMLLAGLPASAQAKGKPSSACKKGGWRDLVTVTGTSFASQDACISYAHQGGLIYAALTVDEFAIPPFFEANNVATPWGITLAADGNMVFKDTQNFNRTGSITPAGAITFQANYLPYEHDIVAGTDGNLWSHGNPDGSTLTSRSPDGSSHAEFNADTLGGFTLAIAWGPDDHLWLSSDRTVVRQAPAALGGATTYALPAGSCDAIAPGPAGDLWCTNSADAIDRITTTGTITDFPLPHSGSSGSLDSITAGPDGNVWFTEGPAGRIGRITPSGTITEFALPTAGAYPTGIAPGPDGNVWFTEYSGNRIGRVTPSGEVNEYRVPTASSGPLRIARGAGGTLWFTEYAGANIGRIAP